MAQGPDHARCPRRRQVSTARHSRYVRTLKDLPAVGATVSLQIRVGRWRCGTRACAVRFFADRLPDVAEFRGRRTCRANVIIRLIGYALGGRPGERLARRIGLSVSNDTLLRWVKRCAQPHHGRDAGDWHRRMGQTQRAHIRHPSLWIWNDIP